MVLESNGAPAERIPAVQHAQTAPNIVGPTLKRHVTGGKSVNQIAIRATQFILLPVLSIRVLKTARHSMGLASALDYVMLTKLRLLAHQRDMAGRSFRGRSFSSCG